jgi:hypothetical protein
MQLCCPACDSVFPIAAGFAEADGKRLAALLADFEPALGRASIAYLALFKPAKSALRISRALRLVGELQQLVAGGDVAKDERTGVRRPTTPALWVQGIEQMLAQRAALTLPLDSHGYLRAVVFGLADKADAQVERDREQQARNRRVTGPDNVTERSALQVALERIEHDEKVLGILTPEEARKRSDELRRKHGGSVSG